MKKTIWFMRGYSNLYHAFNDIKAEDKISIFNILCSHVNPEFVGFESADFFEVEPILTEELEVQKYCEDIIKKYNVDIIFATHKQKFLARLTPYFKNIGVTIITCVRDELFDIVNNKASLYDYLLLDKQCPVNIPFYKTINNKNEFLTHYKEMINLDLVPCIKPTVGVYGEGFFNLQKHRNIINDEKISTAKYKKIISQPQQQLILMDYLDGHESSVDCISLNGELVSGVIRKKISDKYQLIDDNADLMNQVKWLAKKLNINGMFNVQFRIKNNIHYLLEINTRLSGGSHTATIVGFNIPYIAANLFLNIKKATDFNIKINTGVKIYSLPTPIIVKG